MWILVVFNQDTHEIQVFGPWSQEEQGNQAAHNYLEALDIDSINSLLLTVTQIEKAETL